MALNCGIGSSSLKADVKAFDKLHTVRGRNSSYCGSFPPMRLNFALRLGMLHLLNVAFSYRHPHFVSSVVAQTLHGQRTAADEADKRCPCSEVTPLRLRLNLCVQGSQKACELRRGLELRYRIEFFER